MKAEAEMSPRVATEGSRPGTARIPPSRCGDPGATGILAQQASADAGTRAGTATIIGPRTMEHLENQTRRGGRRPRRRAARQDRRDRLTRLEPQTLPMPDGSARPWSRRRADGRPAASSRAVLDRE